MTLKYKISSNNVLFITKKLEWNTFLCLEQEIEAQMAQITILNLLESTGYGFLALESQSPVGPQTLYYAKNILTEVNGS